MRKKYVYLGGSAIREHDASNNVLKEYLRGLDLGGGIGGIIYQKKGSDYYYYHYNHKGDVVALTDGTGKLAAYYEYDAWGNTMTQAQKTGVDNPYRYSTKEWDDKSGVYYFGARYYNPEIGRWTQRDPAGMVDGLNLYSYVANSPTVFVDPWGRQSRDQYIKFFECMGIVYGAIEFGIWPAYDLIYKIRHRTATSQLTAGQRAAIEVAAGLIICNKYLRDPEACLGPNEIADILGSVASVAWRLIDDPGEAEKLLKSLPPNIRKLLGLGIGGEAEGEKPPEPKPGPVKGPKWKPPSRAIWEWFSNPVFY